MTLVRKDDKWVEHYRPYRDIWLLFLERIGENRLVRKSLPELKIQEIPDSTSTEFCSTFKTNANKSKVEDFRTMSYQKSYRPEANLIVNNTQYIREIVYDRNNPEEQTVSPFEKVVNKEFHNAVNSSSIGFDTKLYFEEALKLSSTPEKYKKSDQNPIMTYVPEKLASEKCKYKLPNNILKFYLKTCTKLTKSLSCKK